MNDFYIRKKNIFFRLSIVSGILMVVFLLFAVVFWFKTDDVKTDFQKVTVDINRVYRNKLGNYVYVNYNNKEYELINVVDYEYSKYKVYCKDGKQVEVLLGSDGKLYSNTDGIKTNSSTGKLYFVFLAGTLISITAFAMLVGCVVEANKREKNYMNQIEFTE